MTDSHKFIHWFAELGIEDVPLVGGKNASLGEMYQNLTAEGVRVPRLCRNRRGLSVCT